MNTLAILLGIVVGVIVVVKVEPWTDKWFSAGAGVLVAFLVSVAVLSLV